MATPASQPRARLLFLNIDTVIWALDGVVTRPGALEWLSQLTAGLAPHQDVKVALYGAYDKEYPLSAGEALVLAVHGHLDGVAEPVRQLNAIESHLRQHPDIEDFVAVDSFAVVFGKPLSEHLILSDPSLGGADPGVSELREWLSGAPRMRGDYARVPLPASAPAQRAPRNRYVVATVAALIPEFELVHLTAPGDLTLSIGRGTPGVDWRELQLGQRLLCEVEGEHSSRVVHATVMPPAGDAG